MDTRSDIYSLGVTLWYLLCGRTPFVGGTLEAIHARQEELPLAQLAAMRMPEGMMDLFRSVLALDPAARPQSARELLDALRRIQERLAAGRRSRGHHDGMLGIARPTCRPELETGPLPDFCSIHHHRPVGFTSWLGPHRRSAG